MRSWAPWVAERREKRRNAPMFPYGAYVTDEGVMCAREAASKGYVTLGMGSAFGPLIV